MLYLNQISHAFKFRPLASEVIPLPFKAIKTVWVLFDLLNKFIISISHTKSYLLIEPLIDDDDVYGLTLYFSVSPDRLLSEDLVFSKYRFKNIQMIHYTRLISIGFIFLTYCFRILSDSAILLVFTFLSILGHPPLILISAIQQLSSLFSIWTLQTLEEYS